MFASEWDHIICPWGAKTEEACRQQRSFYFRPPRGYPTCAKHGPMTEIWHKYSPVRRVV